MRLDLIGHEYKYAVEQIMLALFPDERPEYVSEGAGGAAFPDNLQNPKRMRRGRYCQPDKFFSSDGHGGFSVVSRLSYGSVYAQAATVIEHSGDVSRGYARVGLKRLDGKLVTDRHLQRIIKKSFYKAAASFIEAPPVWGALTGIRPASLAAAALTSGDSEKNVKKMLVREFYVSPERAELCAGVARSALCVKQSLKPMDVALYVGIPFCPSRCAYCSFVSNSVEKSFGLIDPFIKTLLPEIEAAADMISAFGLRVIAVYIGGGTPTALPAESFEAVISALDGFIDMTHVREYTVEAGRPDSITEQHLDIMRRYGVGRVCVNPQSMSRDVLTAIGRRHTPEDVPDAARLVRQCGMALNMDVIAGLPGDTAEGFRHTIDAVMGLLPENITIHTLSLKKGSRIMLERTSIPGAADVAKMLEFAAQRLQESGFFPYYLYRQKFTSGGFLNTGWCLLGHEGVYNVCMMEELCSVLALGGGAVTKLVLPGGRIERVFNAKYPREYILSGYAANIEKIKAFYRLYGF